MLEFYNLEEVDKDIYDCIQDELNRQRDKLEMIASENFTSEAVMEAMGSYLTNKYAEGYPLSRYYSGCENVDVVEQLAIDRCKELFDAEHANVQPHSGAQANMAVQFAVLKPGDTIMGMSLNSGGHLTHGAKPTFSGKYYNAVQYEVNPETMEIDYNEIIKMLDKHNPRLFIAGASAYPRVIDFKKIRESIDLHNKRIHQWIVTDSGAQGDEISKTYDSMKCYFMVDMAHIAGLVAAGLHPSPVPYADFVTSTTHKTLRGPRGGIILCRQEFANLIDKAVFPGIQGGPLEHVIAGKAVCFKEALQPEFKEYQKQVIKNSRVLANELLEYRFNLLTGGTDNHLILIDLRNKGINGKEMEERLEFVGITTNKNAVPFDTENKKTTSGIRIGTPAITTRGLVEEDMKVIASIINICAMAEDEYDKMKYVAKNAVENLCNKYPLYTEGISFNSFLSRYGEVVED